MATKEMIEKAGTLPIVQPDRSVVHIHYTALAELIDDDGKVNQQAAVQTCPTLDIDKPEVKS